MRENLSGFFVSSSYCTVPCSSEPAIHPNHVCYTYHTERTYK